jgi:hypothetical protein
LSAWQNCEYLALEIDDRSVAAHAAAKGREFAANLTRSIRMTAARMKTGLIPGSADRNDVDPTSTSIAFEPCQVEDVLPAEATYDRGAACVKAISAPDFQGSCAPYELRNLNAFVSLGRYDDAFRQLSARASGPKASRLADLSRGGLERFAVPGIRKRGRHYTPS